VRKGWAPSGVGHPRRTPGAIQASGPPWVRVLPVSVLSPRADSDLHGVQGRADHEAGRGPQPSVSDRAQPIDVSPLMQRKHCLPTCGWTAAAAAAPVDVTMASSPPGGAVLAAGVAGVAAAASPAAGVAAADSDSAGALAAGVAAAAELAAGVAAAKLKPAAWWKLRELTDRLTQRISHCTNCSSKTCEFSQIDHAASCATTNLVRHMSMDQLTSIIEVWSHLQPAHLMRRAAGRRRQRRCCRQWPPPPVQRTAGKPECWPSRAPGRHTAALKPLHMQDNVITEICTAANTADCRPCRPGPGTMRLASSHPQCLSRATQG